MTLETRLNEIESKATRIPSCMVGLDDVAATVRALKVALQFIDNLLASPTPNTRAMTAKREISAILGTD